VRGDRTPIDISYDPILLNRMSSTAERIKERLNIVDVLGGYIKLEKSGANYKARCPFHNEKTPSFMISPARNSYYCFGCQMSGDIFSFVQEFEKIDFYAALKLLADKAGIPIEEFSNNREDSKIKSENDRLSKLLDQATAKYENQLFADNPISKSALQYLLDRGLSLETIKGWRIGFAPDEWRFIQDYMLSDKKGSIAGSKCTVQDLLAVGLVKHKSEGSTDTYDRFRGRIMFPLFDQNGRVAGFSGRILGPEREGNPKYLNSPETALFKKSELMYGFHRAKDGIRKWGYAILVEGQMDLLMSHQHGFTNTVATSGTSLTEGHLAKIKRHTDKLMIVYDADNAGVKASVRAWTMSLALGLDVKIAMLPKGDDPASSLLKGTDTFRNCLKNSKHIVEFVLSNILDRFPKGELKKHSREIGKAISIELLPLVASIDSAIDRSHFVSVISTASLISEESINEDLKKAKKIDHETIHKTVAESPNITKTTPAVDTDLTSMSPVDRVIFDTLKRLAGIVLLDINTTETPIQVSDNKIDNLENKRINSVKTEISRILESSGGDLPSNFEKNLVVEFSKLLEQKSEKLIFEAELLYKGSEKLDREINDLLINLEESILKKQFSDVMHEMQLSDKSGDKELSLKLLKSCQNISTKLTELQRRRVR
jgi:DNA primase